MESKIVILVVSTILAQSFGVLGSTVSILPDDAVPGLDEISANQALTLLLKNDGFNPLIDMIRKLVAEQVFDVTPSSSDDSSAIAAESLVSLKESIDTALTGILIAANLTSCDAVESARNACYSDLEDISSVVSEAIALAQSSDSSETIFDGIEEYQTQAQDDFKDLIQTLYNASRTCSGATSTDELEVILDAENGSLLAVYRLANSLFNAIRLYANAVVTGSTDVSLLYQIDEAKRTAQVDLMSDSEHKFSSLKAIYINSYLDKDGILTGLAENQYAKTVASYRFANASDALFDRIEVHLTEVSLGISDGGKEDFTTDDAAQAVAAAKWIAGTKQILLSLDYLDSSVVEGVLEQLSTMINAGSDVWTEQSNIARTATNYSEAKAQIDTLNDGIVTMDEIYVAIIFDALVVGKNLTDAVETDLESLRKEALAQFEIVTDGISRAYAVLAAAVSGNSDASASDNIDSVTTIKSEVISASESLADAISTAGIIVLLNE